MGQLHQTILKTLRQIKRPQIFECIRLYPNKESLKKTLVYFTSLVLLFPCAGFSVEDSLCERFYLYSESKIDFSKNEKLLICGDEKGDEWSEIPESQSLFHLKTFLQERGIFYIATEKRGKKIFVHLGKPLYSRTWRIEGAPENWPHERLRHIKNELITPKLLDSVSERVTRSLGTYGYACPETKTEVNVETGEIVTHISAKNKLKLVRVEDEKVEGLDTFVLQRYNPFLLGQTFNKDLIVLSENRITEEGLFQSTYSNITCDKFGANVYRRHIAGSPKLFTFGFGLNTQTGLLARVGWKHLRLGEYGSQIEASLSTSFKGQELNAFSNWYLGGRLQRLHLRPQIVLKHENEIVYERYTGEAGLFPATSWDDETWALRAYWGPTLNFSKSVRGFGPSSATFFALGGLFTLTDHTFELYRTSPRNGLELTLETLNTFQNILSPVNAQKANLRFTYLYNLAHWDPPFLILGIRGAFGTTFTPENIESSVLPSNLRFFLGGSSTIRGFDRLEIPSERGGLTAAFGSVEARFADLLPWSLQPLVFVDAGALGESALSFDSPLYWSPGAGLRWDSPIGVFRSSLAKGLIHGFQAAIHDKWMLYLSYGEEF